MPASSSTRNVSGYPEEMLAAFGGSYVEGCVHLPFFSEPEIPVPVCSVAGMVAVAVSVLCDEQRDIPATPVRDFVIAVVRIVVAGHPVKMRYELRFFARADDSIEGHRLVNTEQAVRCPYYATLQAVTRSCFPQHPGEWSVVETIHIVGGHYREFLF